MEYGTNGSLRTALDAAALPEENPRFVPLSWRLRMAIAAGIAAGMGYLHDTARPRCLLLLGRLNSFRVLFVSVFQEPSVRPHAAAPRRRTHPPLLPPAARCRALSTET